MSNDKATERISPDFYPSEDTFSLLLACRSAAGLFEGSSSP
jgi:hypothetical protein